MKELLISNVAYAASKTSATEKTALTPDQLAIGAVGIYTLDANNKPVLVSTGGDLLVPKDKAPIIFAQGTATGCLITKTIKPQELQSGKSQIYAATTKQISYIGFNTVSGSLNLPTLANYDEAGVEIISRLGKSFPEEDYTTSSATLLASDTAYSSCVKVANSLLTDKKVVPFVVIGGTQTAATALTGTTGVFTKGSAIVAGLGGSALSEVTLFTLDQNGLIVALAAPGSVQDAYTVIGNTGGNITLDRPWCGATQSVALASINASTRKVATPTGWGLGLISAVSAYQQFVPVAYGVFKNATVTTNGIAPAVGMSPGSGTPDFVTDLETEYQINAGFFNTADKYLRKPASIVSASGQYKMYFLDFATAFSTYSAGQDVEFNEYFMTIASTTTGDTSLLAAINGIFTGSVSVTPVS